ncbi:glycosyltransferase [Demequina aurantiaca]|uniref:glycosyltransferase n=1 Tax=Demequina aurantiaca TaxID=676200 RepID=UPI0007829793|nr:glycosyltransferase [Demequina aurantiaca]
MQISVVIPCYRSENSLRELVRRLLERLPEIAENYEIILVVDNSPDATYAVAHDLETEQPGLVRAVLLRRNYGQHNALFAGLMRSRYGVTVTLDDDLQHRPEEIHKLVAPLDNPLVDLVYGVPENEEHGFFRSMASRTVKAGLAAAQVPSAKDVSAFRAFRTDLREGFAHVADQLGNLDVLLSWTTSSIRKVEVEMDERPEGRSGYTLRSLVRHAMNMVTGYGTMPLKLVAWLGAVVSLVGFIMLFTIMIRYFFGAIEVAGFTTLASMIALFSGAMMLSLGILGEYLGRLHFRSMQRPTFLVRADGGENGPIAGLPGFTLPVTGSGPTPDALAQALREQHHKP